MGQLQAKNIIDDVNSNNVHVRVGSHSEDKWENEHCIILNAQ